MYKNFLTIDKRKNQENSECHYFRFSKLFDMLNENAESTLQLETVIRQYLTYHTTNKSLYQ